MRPDLPSTGSVLPVRLHRLLLPAVLVPGLLAAPVLVLPAAAARPVAPQVVELPLAAATGRASLRTSGAATDDTLVLTSPASTQDFGVVGVTWDPSPTVPALDVAVRTRTDGAWSGWTPLPVDPEAATLGEAGARPGTDPLWVGDADG
ncbi:MAG: N-acetylmuramoyl-L-alanine amidase, partial [Frankiales bacterium]|nr:N-acetylmuramoyl-L-alanine amidase [Frankiales bacterium]